MSCQGGPDGHPNGGDQCSKSLDKVDSPHYVLGVSCGDRPRMGKLTAFMKSHVAEPNTKTKLKISRGHKAVAKRKTARFFLHGAESGGVNGTRQQKVAQMPSAHALQTPRQLRPHHHDREHQTTD